MQATEEIYNSSLYRFYQNVHKAEGIGLKYFMSIYVNQLYNFVNSSRKNHKHAYYVIPIPRKTWMRNDDDAYLANIAYENPEDLSFLQNDLLSLPLTKKETETVHLMRKYPSLSLRGIARKIGKKEHLIRAHYHNIYLKYKKEDVKNASL